MEFGGEVGEQSRLGAGDGRAGAEEFGEQLVVDVGAPGQPVVRHLGGDQRAGGLGGDQQPEPVPGGRVGDRGDPALLLGVDGDDGGQRVRAGRQLQPVGCEQGVLPVVGLGGAGLGQVVRDGQAAQPGPGGAERARRAEPALVRQQQGLDQAQVVAAGEPVGQPGQQRRVGAVGGGPHPAGPRRTASGGLPGGDGGGEVGDLLGRAERGAGVVERLEPPPGPCGSGARAVLGATGASPLRRAVLACGYGHGCAVVRVSGLDVNGWVRQRGRGRIGRVGDTA